jgi:FtsH-binding integral membrane protein
MDQFTRTRPLGLEYGTDDKVVFNFFNAVYAWMCVGLAVTAVVAFAFSQSPTLLSAVYGSRLGYLVIWGGSFLVAMSIRSAALRISAMAGTALFILYAAIIGAMISGIFLIYPPAILISALALTAGTFGGMSVYGFITKRDLTGIGSVLIMCAWGLILASVVNLFVANTVLDWIITYGILAVFIGLTAYDTQKLKAIAEQTRGNADLAARNAIVGSLLLYIDFLNIFLSILRILGSRK